MSVGSILLKVVMVDEASMIEFVVVHGTFTNKVFDFFGLLSMCEGFLL